MSNITLAEGVVHTLPKDLKDALLTDNEAAEKWNSLTPLARNEWICWTISVKQEATRLDHIKRTQRGQAASLLLGRLYPSN